jgi:phosphatidylinositol-3-phosphatase
MEKGAGLRALVVAATLGLLFTACAPPPPVPPAPSPTPYSVPYFRHIFVIVLENQDYDTVFGANGPTVAPYLNSLAAAYSLATNFYGVDHLSLTDYIALTSGQPGYFNTEIDCPFYNCVYPPNYPNLADQIESAGKTWKAYMDGMVTPCQHGTEGQFDPYFSYNPPTNTYATRHNPFVYYRSIVNDENRCNAYDVPYGELAADLSNNQLPDFGFVSPDLCHDAHEAVCGIPAADQWLSQEVPKLLNNADFADGGVLFITFDEATNSDSSGCCGNSKGGHIGTLVISPTWGQPAGFRSSTPENHYSLLRTIEDAWGLELLGHAHDTTISPMTEYFTSSPH